MNISTLFKSIHGAIKLEDLIPTEEKNIYKDPNNLLESEIYFDGYNYIGIGMKKFYESLPEDTMNLSMMGGWDKKIQYLKETIDEFINKNDWSGLFSIIDKKLLIPIFIRDFNKIPDKQKYNVFIEVYQRSEYGFEQFTHEFINKIFDYAHLSKERTKRLNKLKKKLKNNPELLIFHGINYDVNPHDDYSWTLLEKVAEFFAYRFKSKGKVIKNTIKFTDVQDYLYSRNEEEILIKP